MTFWYLMRFCWGGGGQNLKLKFPKNTNYRDGLIISGISLAKNYRDVFLWCHSYITKYEGEGVSQILQSIIGGGSENITFFFSWYSHLFSEVFVALRRRVFFLETITLLWTPPWLCKLFKKNILGMLWNPIYEFPFQNSFFSSFHWS